MQPETHRSDDAATFGPPPSPTVPSLRRHQPPQPATVSDDPARPTLRRRVLSYPNTASGEPSSSTSSGTSTGTGTIRISVQTPFADLGASGRKEWRVPVDKGVGAVKDEIADGRMELGRWERQGMRMVWQGRIVRDDETLGRIVGTGEDMVHTFHLVARPVAAAPHRQPERPASTDPGSTAEPQSLETTALRDSVHYLLFLARHHLCLFLDAAPLKWEHAVPPPTVSMELAQDAVVSVIRGLAAKDAGRSESWDGWERAFDGVREIVREEVESEVRQVWATATAKTWGDDGGQVAVEVDFITYMLHVPPLSTLDDTHLHHLLAYLRITSLLPHVSQALQRSLAPRASITTPTLTVPIGRRRARPTATLVEHVAAVPFSAVSHAFFSAMRITALIWMLTRHMAWHDSRFWIMAGMSGTWWLYDALQKLARERRAARAAARQRRAQEAGVAGDVDGAGVEQAGAPEAAEGARPADARVAVGLMRRQLRRPRTGLDTMTALFHLDVDSEQLRLPRAATYRTGADVEASQLERPAWTEPPRWMTQVVLPVYLWFITLVPDFEAARARAIRRRERAMRVIAGELQAEAGAAGGTADAEQGEAERAPAVVPDDLSETAQKYYRRVIERGEGINWEEEREAQRALGIPDEDDAGAGMGMRML
ncbi:hypothetical protein Q5752_001826 [Cryptotrichosporon argae]